VFSQEDQVQRFQDFRGNDLIAFNAQHLSKTTPSSFAAAVDNELIVFQVPGDTYFVISSGVKVKAALFNEMGDQLRLIDLSVGENHLDLSSFSTGIYYLRDVRTEKLISKLVFTK